MFVESEYLGCGEASIACEMSREKVDDVASERRRRF